MKDLTPELEQRTLAPSALDALIRQSPKAELHLHIEGTLEPESIFALAQRNKVTLPYDSIDALRAAYAFTDLQSFLDLYYAAASVLRTPQDFEDMAWAYFQRLAADGGVCAEVFFDPQTHTERGIPLETVFAGLSAAAHRAQVELGLHVRWILCVLRHLSEAEGLETLEAALAWRDHFIGVGLDSSERGHPPEKFARLFARAAALGLRRVAHAGEEGPAAYVATALKHLEVERIDHGVRCLEDPDLVRELAARAIPLTVCPLSNVKLCVVARMTDHPLPQLLDAGLNVTINSDDPAYFGGYLHDNYAAVFAAFPQWGPAQAYRLLRNSLEASFAAAEQKQQWIADLNRRFEAALRLD
jgi:adenosine deaminase